MAQIVWMQPDIEVPADRDRKVFKPEKMAELCNSIATRGLIHPLVVAETKSGWFRLVAGERRLRAMKTLIEKGEAIRTLDGDSQPGMVPVLITKHLTEIELRQIELYENIHRDDLTWQEKVIAVSRLEELMRSQNPDVTASEVAAVIEASNPSRDVAQKLVLAQHLSDPKIASALTEREALKRVADKLEEHMKAQLILKALIAQNGNAPGLASRHNLIKGDCRQVLPTLLPQQFDIAITDPPYGVNAHLHHKDEGQQHRYLDTPGYVRELIAELPSILTASMKEKAHLYLFCGANLFAEWKEAFTAQGWLVLQRPIIWNKTDGPVGSADCWPRATYEMILYAVRGRRPLVQDGVKDLLTFPIEQNRLHEAQKPVALYEALLRQSALFNDEVLDCFCGSGPIFPASEAVNAKVTGIDLDIRAAQQRLIKEKEEEEQ